MLTKAGGADGQGNGHRRLIRPSNHAVCYDIVMKWRTIMVRAAVTVVAIALVAASFAAMAQASDVPAWAYLPEASSTNSLLPKQPAAPATGMNSPLVLQAQDLLRRALKIELMAASMPNDPRAKAMAAAAAAELRGRAAIMMQVNSDYSRSQRDQMERQRDQQTIYCRLPDGRFVQC